MTSAQSRRVSFLFGGNKRLRKYIYIGIGGFAGAILRYLIRTMQIENYHGLFPINTLAINLIGSFALALIMTLAIEALIVSANVRLGITTGFLGAFTTFSSVCKELIMVIQQGYFVTAIVYAVLSIVLGLIFAFMGFGLAWKILKRTEQQLPNDITTNIEGSDEIT